MGPSAPLSCSHVDFWDGPEAFWDPDQSQGQVGEFLGL